MKLTIYKADGGSVEVTNVSAVYCEAVRLEFATRALYPPIGQDPNKDQWRVSDPYLHSIGPAWA